MEENKMEENMLDMSYTQNRELSWLQFNERVLEEATDPRVPLLEQVKFLSIFDSNLDEFFMVRVGSLTDLSHMKKQAIDNKSGMSAEEQLAAIMVDTRRLYAQKDQVYRALMNKFRSLGLVSAELSELTKEERSFVNVFFDSTIVPILNYQIIDFVHPFPHIPNLGLCILFYMQSRDDNPRPYMGLIQLPDILPRFLQLSDRKVILLEKILQERGKELFDNYKILETYVIRVTRNADIDFNDEDFDVEGDYVSHMKKMLKKRTRLAPVRLEIDKPMLPAVEDFLLGNLKLSPDRVFVTQSPVRLGFLFKLIDMLPEDIQKEHSDPTFAPCVSRMFDLDRPVTQQIQDHDLILSYPYEQMDPLIELLREAADDPTVVSIKITLYRIASDSEVAKQLIRAAENNKDVLVLMELRARFDESNNIVWSSRMSQAGCRMIYGFSEYKCHSKILLITRLKDQKISYITQIATGNYNEKTAKLYTDFAFFTGDPVIGRDAQDLFDNFLTDEINGSYQKLMVSPKSMQDGLDQLIDEQIALGKQGYIRLKMNSISDRILIDKLSAASQAGVQIDMMVRGICCIIPGLTGKTENVHVYSLVGRFLEHHRVYQFGRGAEAKIYLSSADFMTRNIRKRVEVACPIEDPAIHQRILDFLDTMFADDVKIRRLMSNKMYAKVENRHNLIAQNALMEEAQDMDPTRRALTSEEVEEKAIEEHTTIGGAKLVGEDKAIDGQKAISTAKTIEEQKPTLIGSEGPVSKSASSQEEEESASSEVKEGKTVRFQSENETSATPSWKEPTGEPLSWWEKIRAWLRG